MMMRMGVRLGLQVGGLKDHGDSRVRMFRGRRSLSNIRERKDED